MSDRFDAELKRSLKDSTARSLEGWEFTPSMRQAVLKRIEEEEEPSAPVRRSRPVLTRPFMWMAAAAAAFVVAFNMLQLDLGFGGMARESEAPRSGQAAKTAAPAALTQESGASTESTNTAQGGNGEKRAGDIASTAAPAESAGVMNAATMDQGESAADVSMAGSVAASPARIHLVVPEGKLVEAPTLTMAAPGGGEKAGIMAVGPEALSMARTGGNAAVRTRESLQLVDADGAIIWEKPLTGRPGPVVTQSGKIATSAGNDLYLFDTEGRQELKLTLPAGPEGIDLSPDGRVAVLVGDTGLQTNLHLVVYQQGKVQFRVSDLGAGFAAFGPDGSLAVTGKGSLQLFGRDGARLWKASLPGSGLGIAFAGGGEVIVAGGQAFHRSGQPLWEVPIHPQDLFTLGPDGPVVLRDSKRLMLVRPADGAEIWTAEHSGRQILGVASSDGGDQVAVLASVDEGAVVWVLNQSGGLRYAEKLRSQPLGVAVEGDILLLLTEHGVESRALPPQ